MRTNKQRDLIESVNTIDEWVSIISELQAMINDDEFILLFIKNDTVIIDAERITMDNVEFDIKDFTFTDFECIYEAFGEYFRNKQ